MNCEFPLIVSEYLMCRLLKLFFSLLFTSTLEILSADFSTFFFSSRAQASPSPPECIQVQFSNLCLVFPRRTMHITYACICILVVCVSYHAAGGVTYYTERTTPILTLISNHTLEYRTDR